MPDRQPPPPDPAWIYSDLDLVEDLLVGALHPETRPSDGRLREHEREIAALPASREQALAFYLLAELRRERARNQERS